MPLKDGELPAGIASIDGQKTAGFSAEAALSAVRMMGYGTIPIAGVAPAVGERVEWSMQSGTVWATPYGGGLVSLVFPKPFPKCLSSLIVYDVNGAALGWDSQSLAGARIKRVDGQNTAMAFCWIAVGC